MNDETIVLTEDDNIFEYLGGCVTTVVLVLEAIVIGEMEVFKHYLKISA